jgi:hypothetical protein
VGCYLFGQAQVDVPTEFGCDLWIGVCVTRDINHVLTIGLNTYTHSITNRRRYVQSYSNTSTATRARNSDKTRGIF